MDHADPETRPICKNRSMDEAESAIQSKAMPHYVKYQYFATIIANLITFSFGSGTGWFSPALPLLLSDNSPLESGKLTIEEVSWIGSISCVGALVGNAFGGYLVSRGGSKFSILLLGIPQLASWLLIIFSTQPIHLEISRFLIGVTEGGMQSSLTIYVAEIADNRIRGQLGTLMPILRRSGILFAFVIVSYLSYVKLAVCFIAITIFFYAVFSFLPQTPQHLLKANETAKAEKSLRFYNFGNRKDPQTISSEMNRLKLFSQGLKEEPKFRLKYLFEPDARIAVAQAIVFSLLNQLSGGSVILTYGTNIVDRSATRVPTEIATLIFGLTQFFGTFVASVLIDRIGRRSLLIISMVGCALGHAALSIYLQMNAYGFHTELIHWLPVACMSLVLLSNSIGIAPLTFVCLVESFPARIRSFGVAFGALALNLFAFIISKYFPIVSEIIQMQGCMLIFSTACAFGAIYMILFVEETKGKDLNVVKNRSKNESNNTA